MQQVKYRPDFTKEGYKFLKRNPIVIASYATKDVNIGGIIRSAESYLTEEVLCLCRPDQAAAVGSAFWQPYRLIDNAELLGSLVDQYLRFYNIVVLEYTDTSTNIQEVTLPENMLLVVGNESTGVPQNILDVVSYVDGQVVHIPQFGLTGSLNVVSATTVALYEWSRQWRKV